jgi:hypothetical protein
MNSVPGWPVSPYRPQDVHESASGQRCGSSRHYSGLPASAHDWRNCATSPPAANGLAGLAKFGRVPTSGDVVPEDVSASWGLERGPGGYSVAQGTVERFSAEKGFCFS